MLKHAFNGFGKPRNNFISKTSEFLKNSEVFVALHAHVESTQVVAVLPGWGGADAFRKVIGDGGEIHERKDNTGSTSGEIGRNIEVLLKDGRRLDMGTI